MRSVMSTVYENVRMVVPSRVAPRFSSSYNAFSSIILSLSCMPACFDLVLRRGILGLAVVKHILYCRRLDRPKR